MTRFHSTMLRSAATFGLLAAASLSSPVWAADSCSGTAPYDFAAQWDTLFSNTLQWQYPETSSCLTASNGLGSRKLDGKLYQKDGQLYLSIDSGPLKRSELRSKTVTSGTATMSAQVYVRTSTSDKKFTVSQLLNAEPSLERRRLRSYHIGWRSAAVRWTSSIIRQHRALAPHGLRL